MGIKSLLAVSVLALSATAWAEKPDYPDTWEEVKSEYVGEALEKFWAPMRDGVRLDTNIFLPKNVEGPYPAILMRSPYLMEPILNAYSANGLAPLFLDKGYAIVFQNERGRYWSEGQYDYLANAGEDGYDSIDWLSKQDWSNGKIGTIGCSSSAENQLRLSTANHPAHAAAIAQAPGAGIGKVGRYAEQGNTFRGGALQLLFPSWHHDYVYAGREGSRFRPQFPSDLTREERIRADKVYNLQANWGWGTTRENMDYHAYYRHLPVSELNVAMDGPVTPWESFSTWTPMDKRWSEIPLSNEGDTFGVPMIWAFSWYDIGMAANVEMFNYARDNTSTNRAKDNQYLVIGPMPHCQFGNETENTVVGTRELGDARFDYQELYLDFFGHFLKGERTKVTRTPAVQYYLMGKNQWVSGDQFPLKGTEMVELYLGSGGNANSLYGDGTLSFDAAPKQDAPDSYTYDPMRPVPTKGGGVCCMGDEVESGAFDQSDLQMRHDVLVYTTPELQEGVNVAGFVDVELYVSSDAPDTDFTIKLIDVYPDGRAYNLDDSIMRARYRDGYDKTMMMKEGNVYKVTFSPLITANYFKPGHKIRIEVSSSNFPRYGRNLNTGGNNFDESEPELAHNKIHHSTRYPSLIRLPVVK